MRSHWFLPANGGDARAVVVGGHGAVAGPSAVPFAMPFARLVVAP